MIHFRFFALYFYARVLHQSQHAGSNPLPLPLGVQW